MMINWWEIQVPDLEQAKAFYGGVFGWTFKPFMDGYDGAHDDNGKMVCALSKVEGDPAGRHIHVVFEVGQGQTLEQILEKVTKHGGSVRAPRTLITEDMGWYATVADPSGLAFDFWTGDPEK
jgi:uncharacterized protein